MDIDNPQHWEQLLLQLLQPERVNDATTLLQTLLKDPKSIVMLFQQLNGSQNIGARQMAAVLARNAIGTHWEVLQPELQEEIKKSVLEIISHEAAPRIIRKAVADIAAKIGKILVPEGKWPVFFPYIVELAQASSATHCSIALYVFQNLVESEDIRESFFLPNFPGMTEILHSGLSHGDSDVRAQAMSFANAFQICLVDDETTGAFARLITPLVQAMQAFIADQDDRVSAGFEVLDFFVEEKMEFIKHIIGDLLQFMIQVGASESLDISIRQKAFYFIEFLISYRPKTFLKSSLLQRVIELCFAILAEPEEDGEDTASKYGSQIIDALGIYIPTKYVWEPIAQQTSMRMKSTDPHARKAAIIAITVISEGCAEQMEDNFDHIMPWILHCLEDTLVVKQAAFVAIAEFAKNIPEAIAPYHQALVPVLLEGLRDPVELLRIKSCYAISLCSESLSEYLRPHLETLLTRLMDMINSTNPDVQEIAFTAIASTVAMAGEASFEPYFPSVIQVLKQWMASQDLKTIIVRARATECISVLAGPTRKDTFLPHFNEVVSNALAGLELIDDAELREYTYRFFERIARLYGPELEPFLLKLVPFLLSSTESMEGIVPVGDQENFGVFGESLDAEVRLTVSQAHMDEKASAISCLGLIASLNSKSIEPFFESAFEVLLPLVNFDIAPTVASSAVVALVQMFSGMMELICEDYSWTKGVISPLPDSIDRGLKEAMESILRNFEVPDDHLVRASLEAIGKIAMIFGPASVMHSMDEIVEWIVTILKRQAECQLIRESFQEGDEEDFSLFSTLMSVIVEFAKSCGTLFVPRLEAILGNVEQYMQEGSNPEYKSFCVSSIGELAEEIHEHIRPYAPKYILESLELMQPDADDDTATGAVFCARMIVRYAPEVALQVYPKLWNALATLLVLNPESRPALLDHSYGLVSQMILINPEQSPISEILPSMVQYLPLRDDKEPEGVIYECLLKLLAASHPTALNLIPNLIGVFAREIILNNDMEEGLKRELLQCLKQMIPSFGSVMGTVFESLEKQGFVQNDQLRQLQALLNA